MMKSCRLVTGLWIFMFMQLSNGAPTQHAELFGGSMSFEIEKLGNDFKAYIKVLTAWKIGTGPCGADCQYSDIGRSTASSRRELLNKYGPEYLGIWQGEKGVYGIGGVVKTYVNLASEINSHTIEKVQLLNRGLHWEMDQADITVRISQDTDYMDVKFIGQYWVNSTVSQHKYPQQEMWMQTKIRSAVRSDTQMSNRSPVLQIKPYQRFQINRTTTVNVNYIDQDDDIVRCEFSSFGTGNGIQTPYGLSMNKADCILKFDVPRSKYKVGDQGIVLVDVMDFNKHDVVIGSGHHREIFAAGNSATARSLSAVPLQFYFEVVDQLNEPEFIDPTPPNSQHYEIYSGVAFSVDIYAKPTDNSSTTEIGQFFLTGLNVIHVDKSHVTKRPELGSRVQSISLRWTPKKKEVGKQLVCSYVVDTLGNDSPLRCFSIILKASLTYFTFLFGDLRLSSVMFNGNIRMI